MGSVPVPANHMAQDIRRKRRVEEMLLSGIKSQDQIATAFGVHRNTVTQWVKEVKKKWRTEDDVELEDKRHLRVRQIENVARMSLNAYKRSMVDAEEITYKEEDCQTCNGTGKVKIDSSSNSKFKVCEKCGGEGSKTVEILKVKGQVAGDANFLRLAKDCFIECAKLEGLGPMKTVAGRRLVETATEMGGTIRDEVHEIYFEGPTDVIIEAMQAYEKLRDGMKNGTAKTVEADQDVIDVGGEE